HQPELAETFFNSVCCRILHRTYFHNGFIFVRPAVATDYLDAEQPAWRVYYPLTEGWTGSLRRMIVEFGMASPFCDIERDLDLVLQTLRERVLATMAPASDCQLQVLRGLFFRNKGAYL